MGFWDWVSGTKRPEGGVPPQPPEQVWNALLAVNRPTAPFVVRDGRPEGVDLIAEWRIVDAQWYEVFAKAGMKSVFQVRMKLHPEKAHVRAVDRELSVSWEAGVAHVSGSARFARGRSIELSFGQGYAFTEQGQYGQVYKYRFSSEELKRPLRAAVTGAGWVWRGVVFGRL